MPLEVGPVVDPFLGSGSTLIACIQTGHDAIGVEREEDYARIADARIRHWDRVTVRERETVIESDVKQAAKEEVGEVDFFSMLSGGAE